MKIGVISDTHIPERALKLPEKVFHLFKDVDLILHAGDITTPSVIDELKTLASVEAVKGNMDTFDIDYPEKKFLTVEGLKLALIHGFGPPIGLRDRIYKECEDAKVIVYGHSHRPYNNIEKGVLFFNPGSPTDTVFAPYLSVGILSIKDTEVQGTIMQI